MGMTLELNILECHVTSISYDIKKERRQESGSYTSTREENNLALYSYFRSKPCQKRVLKRMIEIWTEFGRFKATNKRLADQVRTITKNGWFSDLEIPEIHQQIYRQTHQQTFTTVTEIINTGKP